eukprot:gene12259-16439_t
MNTETSYSNQLVVNNEEPQMSNKETLDEFRRKTLERLMENKRKEFAGNAIHSLALQKQHDKTNQIKWREGLIKKRSETIDHKIDKMLFKSIIINDPQIIVSFPQRDDDSKNQNDLTLYDLYPTTSEQNINYEFNPNRNPTVVSTGEKLSLFDAAVPNGGYTASMLFLQNSLTFRMAINSKVKKMKSNKTSNTLHVHNSMHVLNHEKLFSTHENESQAKALLSSLINCYDKNENNKSHGLMKSWPLSLSQEFQEDRRGSKIKSVGLMSKIMHNNSISLDVNELSMNMIGGGSVDQSKTLLGKTIFSGDKDEDAKISAGILSDDNPLFGNLVESLFVVGPSEADILDAISNSVKASKYKPSGNPDSQKSETVPQLNINMMKHMNPSVLFMTKCNDEGVIELLPDYCYPSGVEVLLTSNLNNNKQKGTLRQRSSSLLASTVDPRGSITAITASNNNNNSIAENKNSNPISNRFFPSDFNLADYDDNKSNPSNISGMKGTANTKNGILNQISTSKSTFVLLFTVGNPPTLEYLTCMQVPKKFHDSKHDLIIQTSYIICLQSRLPLLNYFFHILHQFESVHRGFHFSSPLPKQDRNFPMLSEFGLFNSFAKKLNKILVPLYPYIYLDKSAGYYSSILPKIEFNLNFNYKKEKETSNGITNLSVTFDRPMYHSYFSSFLTGNHKSDSEIRNLMNNYLREIRSLRNPSTPLKPSLSMKKFPTYQQILERDKEETFLILLWALPTLLKHLPLEQIMLALGCAVSEMKIIVKHKDFNVISAVIFALVMLLKPLKWCPGLNVIVILPDKLPEFTESPVPLILGLQSLPEGFILNKDSAVIDIPDRIVRLHQADVITSHTILLPNAYKLMSALRPYTDLIVKLTKKKRNRHRRSATKQVHPIVDNVLSMNEKKIVSSTENPENSKTTTPVTPSLADVFQPLQTPVTDNTSRTTPPKDYDASQVLPIELDVTSLEFEQLSTSIRSFSDLVSNHIAAIVNTGINYKKELDQISINNRRVLKKPDTLIQAATLNKFSQAANPLSPKVKIENQIVIRSRSSSIVSSNEDKEKSSKAAEMTSSPVLPPGIIIPIIESSPDSAIRRSHSKSPVNKSSIDLSKKRLEQINYKSVGHTDLSLNDSEKQQNNKVIDKTVIESDIFDGLDIDITANSNFLIRRSLNVAKPFPTHVSSEGSEEKSSIEGVVLSNRKDTKNEIFPEGSNKMVHNNRLGGDDSKKHIRRVSNNSSMKSNGELKRLNKTLSNPSNVSDFTLLKSDEMEKGSDAIRQANSKDLKKKLSVQPKNRSSSPSINSMFVHGRSKPPPLMTTSSKLSTSAKYSENVLSQSKKITNTNRQIPLKDNNSLIDSNNTILTLREQAVKELDLVTPRRIEDKSSPLRNELHGSAIVENLGSMEQKSSSQPQLSSTQITIPSSPNPDDQNSVPNSAQTVMMNEISSTNSVSRNRLRLRSRSRSRSFNQFMLDDGDNSTSFSSKSSLPLIESSAPMLATKDIGDSGIEFLKRLIETQMFSNHCQLLKSIESEESNKLRATLSSFDIDELAYNQKTVQAVTTPSALIKESFATQINVLNYSDDNEDEEIELDAITEVFGIMLCGTVSLNSNQIDDMRAKYDELYKDTPCDSYENIRAKYAKEFKKFESLPADMCTVEKASKNWIKFANERDENKYSIMNNKTDQENDAKQDKSLLSSTFDGPFDDQVTWCNGLICKGYCNTAYCTSICMSLWEKRVKNLRNKTVFNEIINRNHHSNLLINENIVMLPDGKVTIERHSDSPTDRKSHVIKLDLLRNINHSKHEKETLSQYLNRQKLMKNALNPNGVTSHFPSSIYHHKTSSSSNVMGPLIMRKSLHRVGSHSQENDTSFNGIVTKNAVFARNTSDPSVQRIAQYYISKQFSIIRHHKRDALAIIKRFLIKVLRLIRKVKYINSIVTIQALLRGLLVRNHIPELADYLFARKYPRFLACIRIRNFIRSNSNKIYERRLKTKQMRIGRVPAVNPSPKNIIQSKQIISPYRKNHRSISPLSTSSMKSTNKSANGGNNDNKVMFSFTPVNTPRSIDSVSPKRQLIISPNILPTVLEEIETHKYELANGVRSIDFAAANDNTPQIDRHSSKLLFQSSKSSSNIDLGGLNNVVSTDKAGVEIEDNIINKSPFEDHQTIRFDRRHSADSLISNINSTSGDKPDDLSKLKQNPFKRAKDFLTYHLLHRNMNMKMIDDSSSVMSASSRSINLNGPEPQLSAESTESSVNNTLTVSSIQLVLPNDRIRRNSKPAEEPIVSNYVDNANMENDHIATANNSKLYADS